MIGRLSDVGRVVSGVGDGIVHIDGFSFGRGGAPMWEYGDGRSVLYNGHDPVTGAWSLLRCVLATGKTENLGPGGVSLAVSEGRWACLTTAGLRTNFETLSGATMSLTDTAGRGAIGQGGLIALCSDQSCTSFDIYSPLGKPVHVPGVAYDLTLIDGRGGVAAVWSGGSFQYPFAPARPMKRPIVVRVDGEEWLVGWIDGLGLVVQINGASDGYVLANDGTQFDYDAHNVSGDLVVIWSKTNAEAPGQTSRVKVNRLLPRTHL